MTTLRRFCCDDLFTFNAINLDPLTETYHFSFYLEYLAKWPEYCQMAVGSSNADIAYGKHRCCLDAALLRKCHTLINPVSGSRLHVCNPSRGVTLHPTIAQHLWAGVTSAAWRKRIAGGLVAV